MLNVRKGRLATAYSKVGPSHVAANFGLCQAMVWSKERGKIKFLRGTFSLVSTTYRSH